TLSVVDFVVEKGLVGSNNGLSNVTEKVRRRIDISSDLNDLTVNGNLQEVRDANVSKVSYKTNLLGTSSNQNPSANIEEPFELQDRDMAIEKGRWKGSLEIKTGGVNCVDGLHFLVLEIGGTKTDTARRVVMEEIFDGDINDEGIAVKIMGKEANVDVDKSNSKFNYARAKEK
ncbi:hypothetical protein Gorai_002806, partial [Gossypium raimondii]|nr:hypothetical protein [Gossypium raimondii]